MTITTTLHARRHDSPSHPSQTAASHRMPTCYTTIARCSRGANLMAPSCSAYTTLRLCRAVRGTPMAQLESVHASPAAATADASPLRGVFGARSASARRVALRADLARRTADLGCRWGVDVMGLQTTSTHVGARFVSAQPPRRCLTADAKRAPQAVPVQLARAKHVCQKFLRLRGRCGGNTAMLERGMRPHGGAMHRLTRRQCGALRRRRHSGSWGNRGAVHGGGCTRLHCTHTTRCHQCQLYTRAVTHTTVCRGTTPPHAAPPSCDAHCCSSTVSGVSLRAVVAGVPA